MVWRRRFWTVLRTLSVSLTVVGCGHSRPSSGVTHGNMDDRDVIQTALLMFLDPDPGHPGKYPKRQYIVLRPELVKTDRKWFSPELEAELSDFKRMQSEKNLSADDRLEVNISVDRLSKLELTNRTLLGPVSYVPPPLLPLQNYSWDEHIHLTKDDPQGGSFLAPRNNQDRRLNGVTIFAATSLPQYSRDGGACILNIEMPMGMHVEYVTLVLVRTTSGWKIVSKNDILIL